MDRSAILRNEHAEFAGILLALQAAVFLLAYRAQKAPDQNFTVHEEVIVENGRGVRHEESLLGRLGGSGGNNSLLQEFVVRKDPEGTAGSLAPVVVKQRAGGGDFQVRFLGDRSGSDEFLQLRFDDAGIILLLNGEGLAGYALAFDEDAERTGVDRLQLGLNFFLVGGVGAGERGQGER